MKITWNKYYTSAVLESKGKLAEVCLGEDFLGKRWYYKDSVKTSIWLDFYLSFKRYLVRRRHRKQKLKDSWKSKLPEAKVIK